VRERERGSSVDEVKMIGREDRKQEEIRRKEKKRKINDFFINCDSQIILNILLRSNEDRMW
jgi:hypothetical protein